MTVFDTENLNCSESFILYDINSNGFMGFHETLMATYEYFDLEVYVEYEAKVEQIDCSVCMTNSSLYDW